MESIHVRYDVSDEIIYTFPNFNGSALVISSHNLLRMWTFVNGSRS